MIYLDNNSTTQIDPRVLEAMMPYLQTEYGNAGTIYSLGRRAREAVEKARAQVAAFIKAEPEQIIFTSGGTEANNMVFASLRRHLLETGKTHVITAQNEHDSVLNAVREMYIKPEFDVTFLQPGTDGVVRSGNLCTAVRKNTGLVSLMYVNNETGSENPIEELGEICSELGILFHTDCVQASGCCVLDVGKAKCDFMSISSHKIHGAKGVGALFVKDKSICDAMIRGGADQEFGLRGGTENVAGIVGFGKACEIMTHDLHEVDIHNSTLKQVFYNTLRSSLASAGIDDIIHINGTSVVSHGKTINLRFDDVDGETLLLMLDSSGVCVSAGSACRSHQSEPSHVLLSMSVPAEDARNSIRVSFSKMNTNEEAREAAVIMARCVEALHK